MKCKLRGDSTAVRFDPSCDNTYDSQFVSDWHSKTPVLIDDLGRTWFLLSSSPAVARGYAQPGWAERKSHSLKPEHLLLRHKSWEPACTAIK